MTETAETALRLIGAGRGSEYMYLGAQGMVIGQQWYPLPG